MFSLLRFKGISRASSVFVILIFAFLGVVPETESQIQFDDVTNSAGISFSGPSWGTTWGDFNGDGKPDFWMSTHSAPVRLRLNNGDGSFADASDRVVGVGGDTHGAAWADFDNDGDQDLLQLVGGSRGVGIGPNQLYVNAGQLLEDRVFEYGLDYELGRGRTPMWFDWNQDGYLDAFLANAQRPDGLAPSALFTQSRDSFVNDNSLTGITTVKENIYAQLTHFTAEYTPVLLIHAGPYPDRAYDFSKLPFEEISQKLGFPQVWGVRDTAIADFDRDLKNDIFLARADSPSVVVQFDSTTTLAHIFTQGLEKGFSFSAVGDIRFAIPKEGTSPFIVDGTVIHLKTDDIYTLTARVTRVFLSAMIPMRPPGTFWSAVFPGAILKLKAQPRYLN
jgi:hypothetical protein